MKKQTVEGYFFTAEQLNEYTANVIQQALKTAAEKAVMKEYGDMGDAYVLDKQSITGTFEQIFKKFEV